MTILELGRTQPITDRTSPLFPFVREITLGPFGVDMALLAEFPGLDESGRPVLLVTNVRDVQGGVYVEQGSIEDVRNLQQSYYWDSVGQKLYLNLPGSDNPIEDTYLYGAAQGFSENRVVYIDGIEYQPLIKSAPAIRTQQDLQNYDKLSFITGEVVLANNDGRLDDLSTAPVYGNDVVIRYLDEGANTHGDNFSEDDTTRIATLFVEDYDISLNEVSLRVQDRRKSQTATVPDERFTLADYADADENLLGKVIPVLWGTPRAIPALITNGQAASGNVHYRAAVALTAIGTVQVEVDGEWITRTPDSISFATGEFQLTATDGRRDGSSAGRPLKARLLAPTGIAIARLSDIIVDANERFLGVEFNGSNYDVTEWASEEVAIANGAYYIDSEADLFELIRDVQNGSNVGFRYEIAADGRRTIRVDDETRTAVATVSNLYLQNRDGLSIETDSATLVAEAVVLYGEDYEAEEYLRYVDSGSLADVLEIYNQRPRRDYETLLTTAAAAQERAEFVRGRFDRIRGIGEFVLMGKQWLTLRVYDIVNIEITPDELTQQRRPFYGTWKCKILSVAPDSREAKNTIAAILIEEVT